MEDRMERMSKRCPVLFFLIFSFFLMSYDAFADAVYLKSGKIMRGRIVEKTRERIVLKTGEGEYAVRTTIYLEDVNRIQTDEEYSTDAKFIPSQLFRPGSKKLWEEAAPLPVPVPAPVPVVLEQEEQIKPSDGQDEGVRPLQPVAIPFQAGRPDARADGTISGFIGLPYDGPKKEGDLYIYVMKQGGQDYFVVPPGGFLFQVIGKDSVNSAVMPYSFNNIEAGTYKVFAYWDTASPPVRKRKVRGADMLAGLGMKGDYSGMQADVVRITREAPDGTANIEELAYVASDQPGASMPQEDEYLVSDIYYRKTELRAGRLLLLVKNLGEATIGLLEFDFFVNDEKAGAGPVRVGPIRPGEEKEFDITRDFEVYRKQKEKAGVNVAGALARFKIVSRKRAAVELEKAIFIL